MKNHFNPHTKVRRLGYLKLVSDIFLEQEYLSNQYLAQLLEKRAGSEEVKHHLKQYRDKFLRDDKGIIENTGKGISAQPYLDWYKELGFLASTNQSLVLTKYSKVYQVIRKKIKSEREEFINLTPEPIFRQLNIFYGTDSYLDNNIFLLNNFDKLFFLRQILLSDFLYIKSLLVAIKEQEFNPLIETPRVKYYHVKNQLDKKILAQLELNINSEINPYKRKLATEYYIKIKNRKLDIRSYESIVEPRVSWLLDLGLLDDQLNMRGILKLNNSGLSLLESIMNIYDGVHFVESNFIKTFSKTFQIKINKQKASKTFLSSLISESFVHFKTLAPKRITASQAINYTSFIALFTKGIALEYNSLKDYIIASEGSQWTVDWYRTENDGSLKKTN